MNKSNEFFMKLKKFKINGKTIVTPRKVISSNIEKTSESLVIKDQEIKGINEIYSKRVDKSKLSSMKQYAEIERETLNSILKPVESSHNPTDINYFLLNYDSRTETEKKAKNRTSSIPNTDEIEYLLDILNHRYNDFIVTPLMPYLNGEQYISFLRTFFELNSSFRDRTIAGLIPSKLNREEQMGILDYYISKGCKIFIYDLYGSSPDRHYTSINLILRRAMLYEQNIHEKLFFMATNVRFGRPHRDTPVAPAKDLLSFYSGFDCFGKAHVQKIVFDIGTGGRPPRNEPRIPRLLNIDDYGYHISQNHEIENSRLNYEQLNVINRIEIGLGQNDKICNILNCVEQGLEARRIRNILSRNERLSLYLANKKEIPGKYVEELSELYHSGHQLTLF